ncbi:MAG: hypothetical protein DMF66_19565 [Acidobacteria bacterium]|nr:MAG: hypothetical protein DMF66_19565 [Acidobacteriota bacterium]
MRIDSVLTPLGPRGYRVLPRQNFDALYAMSPDNMQSVRDGIIARINDRKQQYNDLRAEIQGGEVPYEELCPIVDELLPTTNTFVRWQALDDVRRWQQRERLLQLVELILLALTIMFPPAAVVTIPAGMILGLIRVSLGVKDSGRRGLAPASTRSRKRPKRRVSPSAANQTSSLGRSSSAYRPSASFA